MDETDALIRQALKEEEAEKKQLKQRKHVTGPQKNPGSLELAAAISWGVA